MSTTPTAAPKPPDGIYWAKVASKAWAPGHYFWPETPKTRWVLVELANGTIYTLGSDEDFCWDGPYLVVVEVSPPLPGPPEERVT